MIHQEHKGLSKATAVLKSVDVPFEDVHIVTSSGSVFPANKAILSCHSPVLRGMFECCKLQDGMPAGTSCSPAMEIHSEDTDEQVEALIRYSHDPTELARLLDGQPTWTELIPLLEMLFKYDVQGKILNNSLICMVSVIAVIYTTSSVHQRHVRGLV